MLMNIKDLLAVANENNFAIPAFNVGTTQFLKLIIETCEEQNAPVILAIHPSELAFQGESAMTAVVDAALRAKIPCTIHLDHGTEIEQILSAVKCGFTSVMIDASHHSFEENVAISKRVVELMHPLGISVEAELGTIGTIGNDKEGGADEIIYTNPEDARIFVEKTGIDALAVAIGTAHGIYPAGFVPKLKQDLLSEIKGKVNVPLVLHGGSANSDDEIAESVRRGINKINISSDMKDAFYQRLRKTLADDPAAREPFDLYLPSLAAAKDVLINKLELFETVGKAALYR